MNRTVLMFTIVVIAFVLRFVYLNQISRTPYFDNPPGDAHFYFDRSQEIVNGTIIGDEIYFHSSPLYPFFMAVVLGVSGNNFYFLGLVQILIGSLHCLLIFLLMMKLTHGKKVPSVIAGFLAAFYGVFAFFDVELLMIFLTLFFISTSFLLLIKARESKKLRWAFFAGICFGFAALDKVNLLVFIPIAAWFLAGEFSTKIKTWTWRLALVFVAGIVLMILPVTVRNYIVGDDFVLVSSNAGVNFYIGNNEQAQGAFYLPPESGLSNSDLQGSSQRIAERALGRSLKPSEVSDFWTRKALTFIIKKPWDEITLLWQKFLLFVNAYEIPNHLHFYYIQSTFAPFLKIMFIGFWLVGPLGLVGIVRRLWHGTTVIDKLLMSFLLAYGVSLMPFFICARYRLPIVPVLIMYSSIALVDMYRLVKTANVKQLVGSGAVLVALFFFVNWSRIRFDYNFIRNLVATKYLERACNVPMLWQDRHARHDMTRAIIGFKWVIENESRNADAHNNLGIAYYRIGYYSGALQAWQTTLDIDSHRTWLHESSAITWEKLKSRGDVVPAESIPQTPYEQAIALEMQGHHTGAQRLYEELVQDDPFHINARYNLGFLFMQQEKYDKAICVFEKGLWYIPNSFDLMFGLAAAYYHHKDYERARRYLKKCLDLQPDNELVRTRLEDLKRREKINN